MSDIPTPIIGLIIAVFVLVFLVIRTRVYRPDRHAGGGLHRRDHRRHEHRQDLTVITQGFGSTSAASASSLARGRDGSPA